MLQINSTKPDKFTPKIVEKKDDYVRAEYESRILGVSVTHLQYQYGNISFFPRKEQVGMLTRSFCSHSLWMMLNFGFHRVKSRL